MSVFLVSFLLAWSFRNFSYFNGSYASMYFYFKFIWHELWIKLISALICVILVSVRGVLMFLSYGGVVYAATIQTHTQLDLHTLMKPLEMILLLICFRKHDLVPASCGVLHSPVSLSGHTEREKLWLHPCQHLMLLFFLTHRECYSILSPGNSSHLTYCIVFIFMTWHMC